MLTRRLFLAGAVAAPAIVRAESLTKLWVPPEPKVYAAAAGSLAWPDPKIVWYSFDYGTGDYSVLRLYREGDLLAVLPGPVLCNGETLRIVSGDAYARRA